MGVAWGHSESLLVRGNSLVRGFVFRGSTVLPEQEEYTREMAALLPNQG